MPSWPPEAELAAPTIVSNWLPMHAPATDAVGDGAAVAVGLAEGVGVGVGAGVLLVPVGDGLGGARAVAVTLCTAPAPPETLMGPRVAPPPTRRTATSTTATSFQRIG